MTVPYMASVRNIQTIFPAQPKTMPTITDTYDWTKVVESYDWMNLNTKPVKPKFKDGRTDDEVIPILINENETLKREVDHQKQTLVNYQKNVSLYTDDYKRLEIDYRNSVHENDRLQAVIGKYKDTENLNVILMKQVIELKKQLEEKE